MRSYKDKNGDMIEVSEQHLETAVAIKKELQKASPSRKCSWKTHKELMEREGYIDSDTTESYRCLIKDYQKSIGELPEAPKYAEMVTEGKLSSIRELVGEMSYEKRENQKYLKEINKGKRELIDFGIIAEEIRDAFQTHDFSDILITPSPIASSQGKKMIVCLSDMHIGALVDTDINQYNFQMAIARMSVFASRVISEASNNNITDIYVVNLGDVIEHSVMRYAQAYTVEFPFSEQIVRASDLIIKFLVFLSNKGFNIVYSGIAGNHDRITDKDKNIDGDHVVKPINYAIKSFIENSQIKNVTYEQAKDYGHNLELNTRNFKFVHGDLDALKDESLLAKHTSMDGIDYDMIVMGHYHHYREMEVGFGKKVVVFGSLKGADDYGERIRKISKASQGIIIVDENGSIEVKQVELL